MTSQGARRMRVVRPRECFDPPPAARREVLVARPAEEVSAALPGAEAPSAPPVLLVPGFGHGAWAYAEHWLDHIAERGFPTYAMSLRGHGASQEVPDADLRAYVHDVTQVAAGLPRQAVLVGHGAGALVVAMALARYPARAGVLVAPVFGGPGAALSLLWRNPSGTVPGLFGGAVRLSASQLFSKELAKAPAQEYAERLGRASRRAQWQLVGGETPSGRSEIHRCS